jgi:hypothetical protein
MMDKYQPEKAPDSDQLFQEARAFAETLVAIRRAQGKLNPGDLPVGTPEWNSVIQDFAADVLRSPPGSLARFVPLVRGKGV